VPPSEYDYNASSQSLSLGVATVARYSGAAYVKRRYFPKGRMLSGVNGSWKSKMAAVEPEVHALGDPGGSNPAMPPSKMLCMYLICDINNLTIKCSVMSIGCRINDDSFKLYGQTVQSVNTVRDLGVQFCSNLTFAYKRRI